MEPNQTVTRDFAATRPGLDRDVPGAAPVSAPGATGDGRAAEGPLALEAFLPYRLSVLSSRISGGLARLYSERFDLSIAEWRVMAAIGRSPGANANRVCDITAMDKVRVSRAVARLMKAGRLIRESDRNDRRRAKLYLSDAGRVIYDEIVPVAMDYEEQVLAVLSEDERAELDRLLTRLTDSTSRLD